jgi:hypothetical protein
MSDPAIKKVSQSDEVRCESCGEKFACGAKTGECWCFEVEISAETLAELNERFRHCLCPQCLTNHPLNFYKTGTTE